MPKKQIDPIPLNQDLINLLAPMGLEIKRNSLVIGENSGRVYGIVKYPQKVDIGWLSRITNMPGTVVSIGFKPVDKDKLYIDEGNGMGSMALHMKTLEVFFSLYLPSR